MTDTPIKPPDLINSNQTEFAAQEPIFENPVTIPQEKPATIKKPIDPKKKMLLIGAGVLALILLLLAILIFMSSRKTPEQAKPEVKDVTEEIQQKTDLEERLLSIEQDLEKANPTLQDLPFPPVDLELKIDQ